MRFHLLVALGATLCARLTFGAERHPIALCSVGSFHPWISQFIDPAYKKKLNAQGYQVGALEYRGLTAEKARPFNVLLTQWAPTEGDSDGTAAYRSKIPVIEQFVREAAARAGQARQPGRAAPRMGGPEPVGNCYPTYTVLDSLVPRTSEARER